MANNRTISSIGVDDGADNGKVPTYNSTTKVFDMATPGGGGNYTLVGRDDTEYSTTSQTAVDVVTISGLSIPTTSIIKIYLSARITGTGGKYAGMGLKLNSTVTSEAIISGGGSSGMGELVVQTELNYRFIEATIGPRITDYNEMGTGIGLIGTTYNYNDPLRPSPVNAAQPIDTITSISIRGIIQSGGGATLYIKGVYIYEITTV
jgi:hypothetical protein